MCVRMLHMTVDISQMSNYSLNNGVAKIIKGLTVVIKLNLNNIKAMKYLPHNTQTNYCHFKEYTFNNLFTFNIVIHLNHSSLY